MKFYSLFRKNSPFFTARGLRMLRMKEFSARKLFGSITLQRFRLIKHREEEIDPEPESKEVIQVNQSIIDPGFMENNN